MMNLKTVAMAFVSLMCFASSAYAQSEMTTAMFREEGVTEDYLSEHRLQLNNSFFADFLQTLKGSDLSPDKRRQLALGGLTAAKVAHQFKLADEFYRLDPTLEAEMAENWNQANRLFETTRFEQAKPYYEKSLDRLYKPANCCYRLAEVALWAKDSNKAMAYLWKAREFERALSGEEWRKVTPGDPQDLYESSRP